MPRSVRRDAAGTRSGDRLGDDDGVGLGALAQAGRHLHGGAEQVVAVGDRLAGIDADAHLQLLPAGQVEGLERLLDGAGAVHRRQRRRRRRP